MIGPLAQRQVHLTSNVEALKQAHEIAGQEQREVGRQQAAQKSLAEAQTEVPQIGKAEGLRTEERHGREQRRKREDDADADNLDSAEDDLGFEANPAEPHLDFLA